MSNVIRGGWGTDATPRRSYAEVYRRHRVLATLPMVIALLISGYFLTRPAPYTSVATLWVDSPVPNNSTVLVPDPSGWVSTTVSAVLTEELTSDSFLSAVARQMRLRPAPGPAALQALGKDITAGAPGPQLITVTVKQPAASEAMAAANAVATQFIRVVATTLTARQENAVGYDRAALDNASAAVANASSELASYNRAHPGAAINPADPTELQLSRNVAAAQAQFASAQQTYSQAAQAAAQSVTSAIRDSNVSGVPRVQDAAVSAARGSRRKTIIYGGLGGLLGGLTVSGLVLAALMSADTALRTEGDVERITTLEVVGAVNDDPSVGGRRRLPRLAGRSSS